MASKHNSGLLALPNSGYWGPSDSKDPLVLGWDSDSAFNSLLHFADKIPVEKVTQEESLSHRESLECYFRGTRTARP